MLLSRFPIRGALQAKLLMVDAIHDRTRSLQYLALYSRTYSVRAVDSALGTRALIFTLTDMATTISACYKVVLMVERSPILYILSQCFHEYWS